MKKPFELIDSQPTPLGEISLRRRILQSIGGGIDVYEVKLNEEFLMSSLFHEAEEALAQLGLAEIAAEKLNVLVGGLGLGYTALAALSNARVHSLVVVDALSPVIGWHQTGKVPLGKELSSDPRCRFVCADFFALARSPAELGFDPEQPSRRFDAILLDIDHSPAKLLNGNHRDFYQAEGLKLLKARLTENGVFAMWSDDPPDQTFMNNLGLAFQSHRCETITFPNPILNTPSSSSVYIAQTPR